MKFCLYILFFLFGYPLQAQIWTTAELSQARIGVGLVANGDIMAVCGGYYNTESTVLASDRADIYNAATNTWTQADISVARYAGAIAAAGAKIIYAGGFDADNDPSDAVDIYDTATQLWTTSTLPAGPRGYIRGMGIGNKAYFMGGATSSVFTTTVQIYDSLTDTWSLGSNIPFTSGTAAIAAFNNRYIILKKALEYSIYDTETDTWSERVVINTFVQAAPVVTPDEIWFIGGFDPNTGEASDSIAIYHLPTQTWSGKNLMQARCGITACYLNGKIIIAGGQMSADYIPKSVTSMVEVYDTQTNEWQSNFTLSENRSFMSYQETAAVIGNRAFFPGGDSSGDIVASSRIDIYTDILMNTGLIPQLPDKSWSIYTLNNNTLEASADLPDNTPAVLSIYDVWGRLYATANIGGIAPLRQSIDIGYLPAGNYMATLSTATQKSAKRFVKVK